MINMNGLQINLYGVAIAVVAVFVIGFVWYGALFARAWGKEMGYDPNMRPDGKTMAKGMAMMLIGNFLFVWILAFYLAGWKFIPGMTGMSAVSYGVNSALSVWIGFFLPVHLSRVVWERHSWKLFFINSGHHLVMAIVAALILAYSIV
jgi:hypothetical protein